MSAEEIRWILSIAGCRQSNTHHQQQQAKATKVKRNDRGPYCVFINFLRKKLFGHVCLKSDTTGFFLQLWLDIPEVLKWIEWRNAIFAYLSSAFTWSQLTKRSYTLWQLQNKLFSNVNLSFFLLCVKLYPICGPWHEYSTIIGYKFHAPLLPLQSLEGKKAVALILLSCQKWAINWTLI